MKSVKPSAERDGAGGMTERDRAGGMACCRENSEIRTERGCLHIATKSCSARRVSEERLVKSQIAVN